MKLCLPSRRLKEGEAALLRAQMFVRQRRYSEARKCLESVKDAPRSVEAEAAILLTSIADRLAIAKTGSAASVAVPAFPAGVDARTRSLRLCYEAVAHLIRGQCRSRTRTSTKSLIRRRSPSPRLGPRSRRPDRGQPWRVPVSCEDLPQCLGRPGAFTDKGRTHSLRCIARTLLHLR